MTQRTPGATSIERAVEMREEADDEPSYFVHALLPFLLSLAGILIGLGLILYYAPAEASGVVDAAERVASNVWYAAVGVVVLGALISTVLTLVGHYRLIRRLNRHIARDRVLRRGILDHCRTVVQASGEARAVEHVEAMERLHDEAFVEENHRPAGAHLLLSVLVPFWYFYVVWFLLKDLPRHSARQSRFVREAREALSASGQDPDRIPDLSPLDERSYGLSAALLVFLSAVGALVVQWWLYEDPPQHFAAQHDHEDAILAALGGGTAPAQPSAETEAEEGEDDDGGVQPAQQDRPEGEEAESAPKFTVWSCADCGKKYKVPPKRPVRVTCKACGNKEVLAE